MIDGCPSETALRVAMRRAAHQILDDPKVFDDPLALRILGVENGAAQFPDPTWLKETPLSRVLRASLVARSRYAEDELHVAVKRGIHQYVVLGAGLDTFAYRNPYPEDVLHVFEVDHAATQTWKCASLAFDRLAHRVASVGEPFQTFFDPSSLRSSLRAMGFVQIEDIEPEEMNARYFRGRTDKLRVGNLANIMNARV